MNQDRLRETLRAFRSGELSEDDLLAHLRHLPYEDIGFAKVDHHRGLRLGFPEVIFGRGKSDSQIVAIAQRLLERNPNLLITHAGEGVHRELSALCDGVQFHANCRAVTVCREKSEVGESEIGVFSAGTGDLPVAEEAVVTATIMGNRVATCYDVGVAGIHRLLDQRDLLNRCGVIVVVAGMEGALPSVIGGLVSVPVIAVPTSVGYGASFGGLAALLGMLNSCSANVSVVNIDNGFGAGFVASLINRRRSIPAAQPQVPSEPR